MSAPPIRGPSRTYPSHISFPPLPSSLSPVCAGGDVWSCLANGSLCCLRFFSDPLCAHLFSELLQRLAHLDILEHDSLHPAQPAGARRILLVGRSSCFLKVANRAPDGFQLVARDSFEVGSISLQSL